QADAAAVPVFMDAEIGKLAWMLQAIGIEMIDRQPAFILLNQNEGRTADETAIDAKPLGDRAHQVRLAGAERTDQADDSAGKQQRRQPPAKRLGSRRTIKVKMPLASHRKSKIADPQSKITSCAPAPSSCAGTPE